MTESVRSVVVTGAASGIGQAIAQRLNADGWSVVGIDMPGSSASMADYCASVVEGDVRDAQTHTRAADAARQLAPLAGWVNNAGTSSKTPLHDLDVEAVRRIVEINGLGYLWGASAAVTAFVDQRSPGSIINIGSIHGRASYVDHAAYEFTKGGVDALTRSIAVTYGAYGIRANSIAPGGVRTPLLVKTIESSPDPVAAKRLLDDGPPMRRIAEPAEIAALAAFLLSSEASYVSGESVAADGAWSASFGLLERDPDLDERYGISREL